MEPAVAIGSDGSLHAVWVGTTPGATKIGSESAHAPATLVQLQQTHGKRLDDRRCASSRQSPTTTVFAPEPYSCCLMAW